MKAEKFLWESGDVRIVLADGTVIERPRKKPRPSKLTDKPKTDTKTGGNDGDTQTQQTSDQGDGAGHTAGA